MEGGWRLRLNLPRYRAQIILLQCLCAPGLFQGGAPCCPAAVIPPELRPFPGCRQAGNTRAPEPWGWGRSLLSFCSCLQSTSPSVAFGLSVMFNKLAEPRFAVPSLSRGPIHVSLSFCWCCLVVHAQGYPNRVCICSKTARLKSGMEMALLLALVTAG